jgi:ankyrin repeat protein
VIHDAIHIESIDSPIVLGDKLYNSCKSSNLSKRNEVIGGILQDLVNYNDAEKSTILNYSDDVYGYTPLLLAISRTFTDTIRQLLKYRSHIDMNKKNKEGDTAMHLLLAKDHEEITAIVKEILAQNCSDIDFTLKNARGRVPLEVAKYDMAVYMVDHVELIEETIVGHIHNWRLRDYIKSKKANEVMKAVNDEMGTARFALMVNEWRDKSVDDAKDALRVQVREGNANIVKAILEAFQNHPMKEEVVNVYFEDRFNPFKTNHYCWHEAIVQNNINMVKSFLETDGIDINVLGGGQECYGRATNLAIIYSDGDDTGMLQEILKRNPDLEASTPIYNAFMLSKHCHFKLLHAAGARLNSIAQVNGTTSIKPGDLTSSSICHWTIVDSVCYMCRCDVCLGNGICCSFLNEPCCTTLSCICCLPPMKYINSTCIQLSTACCCRSEEGCAECWNHNYPRC